MLVNSTLGRPEKDPWHVHWWKLLNKNPEKFRPVPVLMSFEFLRIHVNSPSPELLRANGVWGFETGLKEFVRIHMNSRGPAFHSRNPDLFRWITLSEFCIVVIFRTLLACLLMIAIGERWYDHPKDERSSNTGNFEDPSFPLFSLLISHVFSCSFAVVVGHFPLWLLDSI